LTKCKSLQRKVWNSFFPNGEISHIPVTLAAYSFRHFEQKGSSGSSSGSLEIMEKSLEARVTAAEASCQIINASSPY
jgi:hypothetical protein